MVTWIDDNELHLPGSCATTSDDNRCVACQRLGLNRKTVSRVLEHAVLPGYGRSKPSTCLKLDPFTPMVDRILEEDRGGLKNLLRTAKRVFESLRDEHGFTWLTRPRERSHRLYNYWLSSNGGLISMNKHLWRGWLIAQGRMRTAGVEVPPPLLGWHHRQTLPVTREMAVSSHNSIRALER